ncbi:MAG: hypothetical protein ACOC1G_03895 [Phycisphaeraceae bacterium]
MRSYLRCSASSRYVAAEGVQPRQSEPRLTGVLSVVFKKHRNDGEPYGADVLVAHAPRMRDLVVLINLRDECSAARGNRGRR